MSFSHILLTHHGRPCPYCRRTMRIVSRAEAKARGIRGRSNAPEFPTRDHVIPRSRMPAMGTMIVCHRCNLDKANRTVREWQAHLAAKDDPRAMTVAAWMAENTATMASELTLHWAEARA